MQSRLAALVAGIALLLAVLASTMMHNGHGVEWPEKGAYLEYEGYTRALADYVAKLRYQVLDENKTHVLVFTYFSLATKTGVTVTKERHEGTEWIPRNETMWSAILRSGECNKTSEKYIYVEPLRVVRLAEVYECQGATIFLDKEHRIPLRIVERISGMRIELQLVDTNIELHNTR